MGSRSSAGLPEPGAPGSRAAQLGSPCGAGAHSRPAALDGGAGGTESELTVGAAGEKGWKNGDSGLPTLD